MGYIALVLKLMYKAFKSSCTYGLSMESLSPLSPSYVLTYDNILHVLH